jgi:hypothetical protein
MKKLSVIVVVLFLMVISTLAPIKANAAVTPPWFICSVDSVGPASGTYYIWLTDTADTPVFTNRYFVLDATQAKQLLAVGLTALANSKDLQVYLGSATPTAGYNIKIMYVTK